MPWQDIVLTFGSIIFTIALIPTIKGKDKPKISTSLTTGIFLIVFAITYLTLNLRFAASMSILSSAAWLLLAYQKYRMDKKID